MVVKINDVEITPYILEGNVQWKRNDIDEEEGSGRAIDGTMQRERIAIKDEWTVPCIPLTGPQAATVLSLIEPEFVKVTYTNPVTNTLKPGPLSTSPAHETKAELSMPLLARKKK